jgi:RHS repeat-associated protein
LLAGSSKKSSSRHELVFYDHAGRLQLWIDPAQQSRSFEYDLPGRLIKVADGLGSVTNTYNHQDLLVLSSNVFGQRLKLTYNIEDLATSIVNPDGLSINMTYEALGRIRTRGFPDGGSERFDYSINVADAVCYIDPLNNATCFEYDALGRMTNAVQMGMTQTGYTYTPAGDLRTMTRFLPAGPPQVTTWSYNEYGWMIDKKDTLNTNLVTYGYFPTGWLFNRVDALGNETKYTYDGVGNLKTVDYVNSTNSTDLSFEYDAVNRLTKMVDAAGITRFAYKSFGALESEDGPWDNDTVSYEYTEAGERTVLRLIQPNGSAWEQNYHYDSAHRLKWTSTTTSMGTYTYAYPNPNWILAATTRHPTGLTLPNGAYLNWEYDNMARFTGVYLKKQNGQVQNRHSYLYNQGSQRTNQTRYFGDYVDYTYDSIGQLKTAVAKEYNGAVRLQENLRYGYDSSNNLMARTNHALAQSFANNALNQVTSVTRSGTNFTVAGRTTMTASSGSVTVNGLAATRYEDSTFAREGFTLLNGTNTFTVVAEDTYVRKDTNVITANLPEWVNFTYDLNGNLLSDGWRTFTYDDENQLKAVAVAGAWKSEFVYDGLGRRRQRTEYVWLSGAWAVATWVRYVYDGNLVLQERWAGDEPPVTYTRGLDLSLTLQGAGGIGGLLSRSQNVSGVLQQNFYHADGNGNVTALMNYNQQMVARYIYDPYGRMIGMNGHLAEANLYRFSSKEYHENTELYYYGYRFYEPNLQRWLNQDPIGERGGLNLYGFVGNDPINNVDPLGLDWLDNTGDFGAGFGDSLSFGLTRWARNQFPDTFQADPDSGAYFGGELASFAVGTGRLAYAGAAKCLRLIKAPNALDRARKIADARNKLKDLFRLGQFKNFRKPTFDQLLNRYKTAEGIIDAATRTNPLLNGVGAGAAAGAIINVGTSGSDGPK